jgi:hypothetical protein
MLPSRTIEPSRRRRFHRSELSRPMQITPRDLNLLYHVHQHRFLSSAHLVALDGGNESNILARLRQCFDDGLLHRPVAQLATLPITGPRPMIYALSTKGARLLRDHGHEIDANIDWTERSKRGGVNFLNHTLGIAEFMVALQLGCRKTGAEIISESEILAEAPSATQRAREPLRWVVNQTVGGKRESLSVVPDGLFGLRFADGTGSFFLLEIDKGTIPIVRRGPTHRSIKRKLETYILGWQAGPHMRQFGKNLRVLIMTNSEKRMEHMLTTVGDITAEQGGSGFLLFAHATDFAGKNILDFSWTNGRGEKVRLTD